MGNVITKTLKGAGSLVGAGVGAGAKLGTMLGGGALYFGGKAIKGANEFLNGTADGIKSGFNLKVPDNLQTPKMKQKAVTSAAEKAVEIDKAANTVKTTLKETQVDGQMAFDFSGKKPTIKNYTEDELNVARDVIDSTKRTLGDIDDIEENMDIAGQMSMGFKGSNFTGYEKERRSPFQFVKDHKTAAGIITGTAAASGVAYGAYQIFGDDDDEY